MPKTLIDVDDRLLREAQCILGVATKKDAVNGALRELARRDAEQLSIPVDGVCCVAVGSGSFGVLLGLRVGDRVADGSTPAAPSATWW